MNATLTHTSIGPSSRLDLLRSVLDGDRVGHVDRDGSAVAPGASDVLGGAVQTRSGHARAEPAGHRAGRTPG